MELSAKIFDCIQPLTIFAKHFMLDVSQGYEYGSDEAKQNPGGCHLFRNKLLQQSLQVSSALKSVLSSHYLAVRHC